MSHQQFVNTVQQWEQYEREIEDALTNNRNRTAGDVRSTFSKYGGNLGETNSVRFMFDRVGEIKYKLDIALAETMFEAAVEAGADDCQSDEEFHIVQTATDQLGTVMAALGAKFGEPEKSAFVWKPNVMTALDEEQATSIMKLIDVLEDNDDVQTVTTNFEVSEDVMQRLLAS